MKRGDAFGVYRRERKEYSRLLMRSSRSSNLRCARSPLRVITPAASSPHAVSVSISFERLTCSLMHQMKSAAIAIHIQRSLIEIPVAAPLMAVIGGVEITGRESAGGCFSALDC